MKKRSKKCPPIDWANVKIPSPEEIVAARTGPTNGWSAKTLASWGIAWPPKHGWRKALEEKYRQQSQISG